MAHIGKVLPSVELARALTDWTAVLEWTELSSEHWAPIALALGDEDLADFTTILSLTRADVQAAMEVVQARPVVKGRLNVALNIVCRQIELPVLDFFADESCGWYDRNSRCPTGQEGHRGWHRRCGQAHFESEPDI